MASNYKPVGGVKSVFLYPAEAISTILFSSEGCEVEFVDSPIEVELLEDKSSYEERVEVSKGQTKVVHTLRLVADRVKAEKWLETEFLERASLDGVVADVLLADNRRVVVGYSLLFGDEQPLRLESLISTSGSTPHDRPSVTLQLVSCDKEFACRII